MNDVLILGLEKLKTIEVRRSACVYYVFEGKDIVVGFNTRLKTW